ncbi:MAG: hypothetical protein FJZ57_03480, partial [Chlamydiae bacterium]|nr:hypothetical protein [Chlamydiota bacterium]
MKSLTNKNYKERDHFASWSVVANNTSDCQVLLDNHRTQRVFSVLSKDLLLKSRSTGLFQGETKTVDLIYALFKSFCAMDYFAKSKELEKISDISSTRVFERVTGFSIRGSYVSSILMDLVCASDLDTVLKLPIDSSWFLPTTSSKPRFDVRSFCIGSTLLALKSLFPDQIGELVISKDVSSGSCLFSFDKSCKKIIDYATGIFTNFCVIQDNSKCILSFPSHDEGLELDVTIQFLSSKPQNVLNEESGVNLSNDSCSFVHDALEILVPFSYSKVDNFAKIYFSSLFGFTISDIEHYLHSKQIKIINPTMYQGVIRTVYEVCKGRTLCMEEGKDYQSKIICQIIESSAKSDVYLDFLHKFVVKKSNDKPFFLHMFLNLAHLILTIKENIQSEDASELSIYEPLVDRLIAAINAEAKKERFLENIPVHLKMICNFEFPVNLFGPISRLKTHLGDFQDARIVSSQNGKMRIAGLPDKKYGYVISNQATLSRIKEDVNFLKTEMGDNSFQDFFSIFKEPFRSLNCCEDELVVLLYYYRLFKMPKEQLVVTDQFFLNWVEFVVVSERYSDVLDSMGFIENILCFFNENKELLFDNPGHLDCFLSLISKENSLYLHDSKPSILSVFFHFVSIFGSGSLRGFITNHDRSVEKQITLKKDIIEILTKQEIKQNNIYPTAIELLRSVSYDYTESQVCVLVEFFKIFFASGAIQSLDQNDVDKLKSVFFSLIDAGLSEQNFNHAFADSNENNLDLDSLIFRDVYTYYYQRLGSIDRRKFICSAVVAGNVKLLERAATLDKELYVVTIIDFIKKSKQTEIAIQLQLKSQLLTRELLAAPLWLCALQEINPDIAFSFLKNIPDHYTYPMSSEALSNALTTKTIFGIKCLVYTPLGLGQHLYNHHKILVLKCIERSVNKIPKSDIPRWVDFFEKLDVQEGPEELLNASLSIIDQIDDLNICVHLCEKVILNIKNNFKKNPSHAVNLYSSFFNRISAIGLYSRFTTDVKAHYNPIMIRFFCDKLDSKVLMDHILENKASEELFEAIAHRINEILESNVDFRNLTLHFSDFPGVLRKICIQANVQGLDNRLTSYVCNNYIIKSKMIEDVLFVLVNNTIDQQNGLNGFLSQLEAINVDQVRTEHLGDFVKIIDQFGSKCDFLEGVLNKILKAEIAIKDLSFVSQVVRKILSSYKITGEKVLNDLLVKLLTTALKNNKVSVLELINAVDATEEKSLWGDLVPMISISEVKNSVLLSLLECPFFVTKNSIATLYPSFDKVIDTMRQEGLGFDSIYPAFIKMFFSEIVEKKPSHIIDAMNFSVKEKRSFLFDFLFKHQEEVPIDVWKKILFTSDLSKVESKHLHNVLTRCVNEMAVEDKMSLLLRVKNEYLHILEPTALMILCLETGFKSKNQHYLNFCKDFVDQRISKIGEVRLRNAQNIILQVIKSSSKQEFHFLVSMLDEFKLMLNLDSKTLISEVMSSVCLKEDPQLNVDMAVRYAKEVMLNSRDCDIESLQGVFLDCLRNITLETYFSNIPKLLGNHSDQILITAQKFLFTKYCTDLLPMFFSEDIDLGQIDLLLSFRKFVFDLNNQDQNIHIC